MQLLLEHSMMKMPVEKLMTQHKSILQTRKKQVVHKQEKYIVLIFNKFYNKNVKKILQIKTIQFQSLNKLES